MAVLEKMEKKEERTQEITSKYYTRALRKLLDSRLLGVLLLVSILLAWGLSCLMFYTTAVTVKMLPLDNKPEFNVVLNMPAGTAMPVTAGVAQDLASELRVKIPEIVDLQVYAGTASPYNFNGMIRHYYLRQEPWFADIQIKLLD
jgi:multidrug efflux pump subunit AcrB